MTVSIDEFGHPKVGLVISGNRGKIDLGVIIDTGFDGEICLPVHLAVYLGLDLCDIVEVELADGSLKSEMVFRGNIQWFGEEKSVTIFLTNSQEGLIGTALLKERIVNLDFKGRILNIE